MSGEQGTGQQEAGYKEAGYKEAGQQGTGQQEQRPPNQSHEPSTGAQQQGAQQQGARSRERRHQKKGGQKKAAHQSSFDDDLARSLLMLSLPRCLCGDRRGRRKEMSSENAAAGEPHRLRKCAPIGEVARSRHSILSPVAGLVDLG